MNNLYGENMYNSYGGYQQTENIETFSGDVIPTPPTPQNGIGAMLTTYNCNVIRRNAIVETEHAKCVGYVTQQAMMGAAALGALRQQIVSVAPQAASNCDAIYAAYTQNVCARIKGW